MTQTNQQDIAASIAAGVEEINAYLTATGRRKPETGATTCTVEQVGNWTWIKFPSRPTNAIMQVLDRLDARWSKKRSAWYITRPLSAAEVAAALSA